MELRELVDSALRAINDTVKPLTLPVGIKMLKDANELPANVRQPSKTGVRYALCQAITAARTYGWSVALGQEDQSCPIAHVLMGTREALPFYTEGNLACGMYTETLEAGKASEAVLSKFGYQEYKYVLIMPLSKFTVEPDVVLVYGLPAQVMRLVIGALYKTGGAITSSFTGRGGCGGTIAGTMAKGECQVILPGNGERVFGQTQDFEMAFAIPWKKLGDVAEGLTATHKGGVRYPIPTFLNYEASFPPKYKELEAMWKK